MKRKGKTTWIILLLAVLIAVFGYSMYRVIAQLSEDKRAKNTYDALAETVRQIEAQIGENTPDSPDEDDEIILIGDEAQPGTEIRQPSGADPTDAATASAALPERSVLPQLAPLYVQNPDLFGWLRIEGTPIDYPVMFTPNDPEYYLHRDFYGEKLNSGSLFVDSACPPDGNYYLIYGHSMKNKTMFGTLKQYANRSYWEEHRTVQFCTLYEKRTYTVIAAFYSKVDGAKKSVGFHYYDYRDLSDPVVFREFVSGVLDASLYDTGVGAEYGDELITLSTCNKRLSNGRFVVVAKRVS